MLFQSSLYFVRLAIAVTIYWSIGDRLRVRFAAVALLSTAVVVYLLHKCLQNEAALFFATLMAALVTISYAIGRRLMRKRSQYLLIVGIVAPFSICLAAHVGGGLGLPLKTDSWLVPVSLGFFALRQSHFVYECYRGGIKQADFISFVAYILFFPTLVAGPLERFPKFVNEVTNARLGWDHFAIAAERLVGGAFKKFFIADGILTAALPPDSVSQSAFSEVHWWTLAFACSVKLLYVYFDFSGYTDMARGTARLFGIELIPNFNFPLFRSNLAEFWRGWHISLSSFLREYVYFPLVAKYRNTVLPLLATMIASAAWHGIEPGWLLWGVHHGIGLVFLARFQRGALKIPWLAQLRTSGIWRAIATLSTWFWVVSGFALTWHVDNVILSLRIYFRFLTFGLVG
jgi:D-alanyl-lipoteichoic acid acyltransferase DltB (MBOAT superfamily)